MNKSLKRVIKISAYSTLTAVILAATAILVTIGRGYFVDFRTGQIAGGGLVLVDSRPDNAQIFVNDKGLGKNSATRVPLKAGQYHFKLVKEGYRDWQKNLTVNPSEITWAQYPFLLPDVIKTEAIVKLNSPTAFKQSPDMKYLLVASAGNDAAIRLVDTGRAEVKEIFRLSPEQLAAGTTIDANVWAADSEHILIGLKTPQSSSFIVLNALNPAEISNITQDFGLPFSNLQFNARNWRELYWLSPEGLRRVDLANKTVSAVLAANVTSFLVTEEAIFYTQTKDAKQQLVRQERDGRNLVLIENLPISDYQLETASYGNKDQVILLDKTNRKVSLYQSTSQSGQTLTTFDNIAVQSILVSPENRFLIMRNGADFVSYEFEFGRLLPFSLPAKTISDLAWMDEYHLVGTVGTDVVMFEFDGGNSEQIATGQEGLPAFSARNQDFIYSIGKSQANDEVVLHASKLKQ